MEIMTITNQRTNKKYEIKSINALVDFENDYESNKHVWGLKARWIDVMMATTWEKTREDDRRTLEDSSVEIHVPDDYVYTIDPFVDSTEEQRRINKEEQKIRMAPKVFAVLSALNIENEFTITEKEQQMADQNLLKMKTLVEHSAFLEAKALLEVYTPTAYFTTPMKNKIISKIDEILEDIGEL